ncbi:MAG: Gmad2 immunoglobulin-like domain-containing protein [Gaiellaceae bacterium]
MSKLLLPAGILLLLATAAGCGSHDSATTTQQTTPPTTTAPAATIEVTVFRVHSGKLQAQAIEVPQTQAVAGAALHALGVSASVQIADGTATVDLAQAPADQVAEIVYTLTQFSSVQRVDVAGRSGLTRDDLAAYEPPILVETPAAGASVPATLTVSGTASVFEATLVIELRRNGTVLAKQTVTASEGAPGRGTFSTTVHAPSAGAATIAAYAPSAADGTPQHEQDIAVTITP